MKENSVIIRVSNNFDKELRGMQRRLSEKMGINLSKIDVTNLLAKEFRSKEGCKGELKFKMIK